MNYTSEQIQKHGDLIVLWEKSEPKPIIQYRNDCVKEWRDCYDNHVCFAECSEYRVKPKLTREEITAQWVKDNDLKVGDNIKVISSFSDREYKIPIGLNFKAVNKIYPVDEINKYSIRFDILDNDWEFPIECLEKIKEEYVPFTFDDNEIFRDKWVKRRNKEHIFRPVFIAEHNIFFEGFFLTYQDSFKELEFLDGTPFGKKI